MADNKVKRSLPATQPERRRPNPEPVELMPVKAHVYRALAEVNGSFEKLVHDLQALEQISFLRTESLVSVRDLLGRVRAQINQRCALTLHDRELANAGYFDRACADAHQRPEPS